jgi:pantothenate kinase
MGTNMWEALSQKQLTLDQTNTPLEIERQEVEQFYLPLAIRLIELIRSQKRILVAVAGPPGSGKTAFATFLVAVINAEVQGEKAALIQQDGWHYPNVYLDSHTIYHNGEEIPLRRLKGSPETYDTDAAYAFLKNIKAGGQMDYPVYSRQLHDPIPNAGRITSNHQIVVLEGNYWLLQEAPWRQFQTLFDERIFLTASPEKLIDGLHQRHLRGGKTAEFTRKHMAFVDMPNIERVLKYSGYAQVVVHKTDSRQISSIEYLSDFPERG